MSSNFFQEKPLNPLSFLQQHYLQFCKEEGKRETLCFRERLEIHPKDDILTNTKPIGNCCLCVENSGPKQREFLICTSLSMTINGFLGGSKLISSATEELQCLEEKRNEFLQVNKDMYEKNLYISTAENCHNVQVSQKTSCKSQENSFNISSNTNLLSDGCNILLMRYLALTNFDGLFTLNTITIDGILTTCNYGCFCAKPMEIYGFKLDVYKITQIICQNECAIHNNEVLLTKQGKILSFNWIDTRYMMKINPLLNPFTTSKMPILKPLRENWKENMEITSNYFDRKISEERKVEKYLSFHPGICYLLADYIETLLCRKPSDILTFTINYFRNHFQIIENFSDDSTMSKNHSSVTSNTNSNFEINFVRCILINESQLANNSKCSSGRITKSTSSTSLISNFSALGISSANRQI